MKNCPFQAQIRFNWNKIISDISFLLKVLASSRIYIFKFKEKSSELSLKERKMRSSAGLDPCFFGEFNA
jgi:hypothetical protein